MTAYNSYIAYINKATLLDCQPVPSSLFESSEQSFELIVAIDEEEEHRFTINEREKNIVLEKLTVGDSLIFFEERFDDIEKNDIIIDNESLLKNKDGNVARVNQMLEDADQAFDSDAYEHCYNAFEYTYERMTETVKENVETIYLYLNTLANMKNGQTVKAGTETVIRKSIEFALKQDISFEELMTWFDLDQTQNIKTAMSDADSETREEFYKTLVATKTELNVAEADIFECFKDLTLSKEAVGNAE